MATATAAAIERNTGTAPIPVRFIRGWSEFHRGFCLLTRCDGFPEFDGVYMGRTWTDARCALADWNACRTARGFRPLELVSGTGQ